MPGAGPQDAAPLFCSQGGGDFLGEGWLGREGAEGKIKTVSREPARHSYVFVCTSFFQESWETLRRAARQGRSEEHTSELQSLMRISYAVFCLKKKKVQLNT